MANRRIEMHEYREALYRMRRGERDRQMARDGVMGRHKLARLRSVAEQEGWLDVERALPPEAEILQALRACRQAQTAGVVREPACSVEAFAELIAQWHGQGVQGVAIHASLVRNHGFGGHYSSVRRFLAKLKGRRIDATMILEFAPGEAAQVDFGAGPAVLDPVSGERVRTWFFVMTLCFSRHQYVEFVRDQSAETWQRCHHHALRHFGGVVRRVIIDNPKCAITRAVLDDPQVQRAYAECAQGYGFLVSPCPPADPAKKGIVESGVKYVKGNFLALREYVDLDDLNRQVRQWVMHEAGRRIHGTTREQPLALFELERAALQPLPARAPEVCAWARASVHRDTHVQFGYCLYSVPYTLIGTDVFVRATASLVQAFDAEHRLLASHPRGTRRGQRFTQPDHLPPAAKAWSMQTPRYCLEQARAVGPACLALVQRMFGDRVLDRLRGVQGLLRLADTYGGERLEAACRRVGEVDLVSSRTVRLMLERGLESEPPPAPTAAATSPVYQGKARFYRPATAQQGALELN
jgi:transposase